MKQVVMLISLIWITNCNQANRINPFEAQTRVRQIWQTSYQGVWQIEGERLPLEGGVVVKVWQVGKRYRWEILEAWPVDFVGQTLVFNGLEAWRYQRLTSSPVTTTTPHLAPVTEIWAMVAAFLRKSPVMATAQSSNSWGHHYEVITLHFADGSQLVMQRDIITNLPYRLQLIQGEQVITLKVRQIEPLEQPIEGLFAPP